MTLYNVFHQCSLTRDSDLREWFERVIWESDLREWFERVIWESDLRKWFERESDSRHSLDHSLESSSHSLESSSHSLESLSPVSLESLSRVTLSSHSLSDLKERVTRECVWFEMTTRGHDWRYNTSKKWLKIQWSETMIWDVTTRESGLRVWLKRVICDLRERFEEMTRGREGVTRDTMARKNDFLQCTLMRDSDLRKWLERVTRVTRPTQSIMYVPLQVNRSQKCILLFVQYKYIKSCSGAFYSPESDPPHKILRYWVYYSTQLIFGFPPDRICQVEMICVGGVPVLKRHFGGAGP